MILIINSAGCLNDVEKFYANKSREEINNQHMALAAEIAYLLPLAGGIIVSCLREAGFRVIHSDLFKKVTPRLTLQLCRDDFSQWLEQDRKTHLMEEYLQKSFAALPPDLTGIKLIGMSVRSYIQYPYALSLAKALHLLFPQIPICLGGSYMALANHNLPGYISYIVKGDGRGPICHLADHVINKASYDEHFPGLYKIKRDEIPGTERNREHPDSEVLPDYSDLDLNEYLNFIFHPPHPGIKKPRQPYLVFNYRTGMGCTGKCSFCTVRKVDSFRLKSVNRVIEDLKSLARFTPDDCLYVIFSDSSINDSPGHINDILDRIIEEGINIQWFAYARIQNMTPELLKKFSGSGCRGLFWGIEAATSKMLAVYCKRHRVEEAERCILQAVDYRIVNILSVMYNGPNEREEDFEALLRFLEKMSLYQPFVVPNLCEFILDPYSDMSDNPAKYNIEIIRGHDDLNSTIRPFYDWKHIGEDFDELKREHESRKKRIETLMTRLWGKNYY